jgi:hypothetical protein
MITTAALEAGADAVHDVVAAAGYAAFITRDQERGLAAAVIRKVDAQRAAAENRVEATKPAPAAPVTSPPPAAPAVTSTPSPPHETHFAHAIALIKELVSLNSTAQRP